LFLQIRFLFPSISGAAVWVGGVSLGVGLRRRHDGANLPQANGDWARMRAHAERNSSHPCSWI